jgi:hypothetical protein
MQQIANNARKMRRPRRGDVLRNWARVGFIQYELFVQAQIALGFLRFSLSNYKDTANNQKTPAARIVFRYCRQFAG